MVSIKSLTALVAASTLSAAASLQQVPNYNNDAANVPMYVYVPDKLAASPAIIVAIHYCTGSAQAYYTGSPYAKLADQHGFVVIFPSSPHSGTCWDVSSPATLKHGGKGDSQAIANMVTYALQKYKGDKSKVFVTGSSSGAMMTNVMAATYPELFAAGTVYNGVPAGCFYTGTVDGWNSTCAHGEVTQSAQGWANTAKNMYPGYSGSRPRMQIYHGSVDTTLYPANYGETIKQWAGVFGLDSTKPDSTLSNNPQSQYTTQNWGNKLQGIMATGVGHTVPINGDRDLKWFGIA